MCDISGSKGVDDRVVIVNVPLDFRGEVVLRPFGENHVEMNSASGLDVAVEIHDFEVSTEVMKAFEAKDWGKLRELTPRAERPTGNSRRSEGAKKAAQTRRENKERAEREAADASLVNNTRAVIDAPQA